MTRPDYITCIRQTREDRKGLSWCGRMIPSTEFAYESIDHAANAAGERLVACPDCCEVVLVRLSER